MCRLRLACNATLLQTREPQAETRRKPLELRAGRAPAESRSPRSSPRSPDPAESRGASEHTEAC
eukprot:scaffold290866_cov21-Tisochrysis_lutea.AAC.3